MAFATLRASLRQARRSRIGWMPKSYWIPRVGWYRSASGWKQSWSSVRLQLAPRRSRRARRLRSHTHRRGGAEGSCSAEVNERGFSGDWRCRRFAFYRSDQPSGGVLRA